MTVLNLSKITDLNISYCWKRLSKPGHKTRLSNNTLFYMLMAFNFHQNQQIKINFLEVQLKYLTFHNCTRITLIMITIPDRTLLSTTTHYITQGKCLPMFTVFSL